MNNNNGAISHREELLTAENRKMALLAKGMVLADMSDNRKPIVFPMHKSIQTMQFVLFLVQRAFIAQSYSKYDDFLPPRAAKLRSFFCNHRSRQELAKSV